MHTQNLVIIALDKDGNVKLCRRVVTVPAWAMGVIIEFCTAFALDYSPKAKHVAWYDPSKVNANGTPTAVYQAR